METDPEFFRKMATEFKRADTLLSSQLKLIQEQAEARQAEAARKSAEAEHAASAYMEAIEKTDTISLDYDGKQVAPSVDDHILELKKLSTSIGSHKANLDRVNKQIGELNEKFQAALSDERFYRRRENIWRVGITTAAIATLIALHFWLLSKTTLDYSFSLDSGEFPSGMTPDVTIDGKPFTGRSRINIGPHHVTVSFSGGETFGKKVWIFYGKNDLGRLPLETSKGSLMVAVRPSPATVMVDRGENTVSQGAAPFKADPLPVGDYTVLVKRGEYEESHTVQIGRQQVVETNIDLALGIVQLLSSPPDADFELAGNGRNWHGKLPEKIDDVPAGSYTLTVTRKGWEQTIDLSVSRQDITTNLTEFRYGSIEVTSDPGGLIISTNGVDIGKTPLTLTEMRPGRYTLSASDGENDLMENVNVAPEAATKQAFAFNYGIVQLSSIPSGATVVRKGKEIGITPLTLSHIPVGDTKLELRLAGYLTTNLTMHAAEGTTLNLTAKLISERYFQSMQQARDAFENAQYADSQKFIAAALESATNDPEALQLQDEVSKAATRAEEARKEAERAADMARKAAEQNDIKAIIERGIEAIGGRDAINRFNSFKSVTSTVGKMKGSDFSLRSTTYMQFPASIRIDQTAQNFPKRIGPLILTSNDGRPTHSTLCTTSIGSWEIAPGILGATMQMSSIGKTALDELHTTLYLREITSLVPLLRPGFELEMVPDSLSILPNAAGIKVHLAGQRDLTLYFDKDTGLPVGLETDRLDNHGNLVHDSERYSNYQNYSGLLQPALIQYSSDANTFSTVTIDEFEPLHQYYGNIFDEPPRRQ